MSRHSLKRQHVDEALTGYAFIAPQMAGFLVFVLVPLVMVVIYSFQRKNLLFGTSVFAGLANYQDLVHDPLFFKTLKNTVVFSLGVVPLNLVLSLALALYIGTTGTGVRFVRSVIFLPVVTSGVAWSIVCKYLLSGSDTAPVNFLIGLLGIPAHNWLFEPGWAMASVVVTRVMKNLGMNVLIFMGAVMNLPQDVIEAGRIDGAKGFRLFWKIKLPLLMPSVLMVAIVTVIGSMRVFDTIKLMTDGGPEGSTMVMVYYIYHKAFRMFDTSYASALSVVLFAIVLILTAIQWSMRGRVDAYEN